VLHHLTIRKRRLSSERLAATISRKENTIPIMDINLGAKTRSLN
jgi:hypothetical protein